jgi:antitoxin MazE
MNITQSIQKWGNGTGVRIPQKVLKAANLHVNQSLNVSIQDNAIVLTPIKESAGLTLEAMMEGVTPQLVGGEVDWGEEIGLEHYER